jgi:hypothetical protein
MTKNECKIIKLARGVVYVYDHGGIKLHAYRTNDPMNNYVMLVEKNKKCAVIETPCFHRNRIELMNYIEWLGIKPVGVLVSYHFTGRDFLPGAKRYATQESDKYRSGRGLNLVNSFAETFGSEFDKSIIKITNYITGDSVEIAGIKMNIIRTPDAFDIEIPEIKAMYVHMMGHDEHSFVSGVKAAEAEIAKLSLFLDKKYNLILTSHHAPEDGLDVLTKVKYLQKLVSTAHAFRTRDGFRFAMRHEYPKLTGQKLLDMTSDAIY